jgi:hypothetical protein
VEKQQRLLAKSDWTTWNACILALLNNNVIITRLINNPQAKETEGSESQIDLGLFSFLFPSFFLLEGIWFFFWVFDQEKLSRVGEEES